MLKEDASFKVIVKTSFGLEDILMAELKSLGAINCNKGIRMVSFQGNKELLYKSNLWTRTANRIIVPFSEFYINNKEDLYHRTKKIDWSSIIDSSQTFAIDLTTFSSIFSHTKYAAYRAKDAIVDHFKQNSGKRPNVNVKNPDIKVNLHISSDNRCTFSLDSSGDPLFKRGYRNTSGTAPLKEDLAAGLILLSGWLGQSDFIDLFCGSGTLLIEAALIANNIPPNINRATFGFMNWTNYDDVLFEEVVERALEAEISSTNRIIGIDKDKRAYDNSRANIKEAGLTDKIELSQSNAFEYIPPKGKGIVVSNPPYGERLNNNISDLYKSLGDTLKRNYVGYDAWILSSNMDALKNVGLRPSRKIKLYNGSLECRLVKYEMYKGTKKLHKLKQRD